MNAVKKLILIAAIAVAVMPFCFTAHAADSFARLTHNDHDALVLGTVSEADGSSITIEVSTTIISGNNLNEGMPKRQINPDKVRVTDAEGYTFWHGFVVDADDYLPKNGDYVLASVKSNGFYFDIAWGIYKVDCIDPQTMSVLLPPDSGLESHLGAAAIKAFVNSGGLISDFAFDYGNGKITSNGAVIYNIFDGFTGSVRSDELIFDSNRSPYDIPRLPKMNSDSTAPKNVYDNVPPPDKWTQTIVSGLMLLIAASAVVKTIKGKNP